MAHNRNAEQYHYGIDKEIQDKLSAKFNLDDAKTAIRWIAQLSGENLPPSDIQAALKSGVALCLAINKLAPGSVKQINKMNAPFMQRENITNFLTAARAYGLRETDLFVSVDLFEGQNLVAVIDCIFALGGLAKAKNYSGVTIGVKAASAPPQVDLVDAPAPTPQNNAAALKTAQSAGVASQQKKFKWEVKASGDTSGLTKQTMGSYETQPESYSLSSRAQIVKTTEKSVGNNVISQQNAGSKYFGTEKRMDSIDRMGHFQ